MAAIAVTFPPGQVRVSLFQKQTNRAEFQTHTQEITRHPHDCAAVQAQPCAVQVFFKRVARSERQNEPDFSQEIRFLCNFSIGIDKF
jgi:hypothetical protein